MRVTRMRSSLPKKEEEENRMNYYEQNEKSEMGMCPRCEEKSFERLRTYDTCYSCGYSSAFDCEHEGRWKSNAEFMAWAAKNLVNPKKDSKSIEGETVESKWSA